MAAVSRRCSTQSGDCRFLTRRSTVVRGRKDTRDAIPRLRVPVTITRVFACQASYPMRATGIDGIGVPALLRRTFPVPARPRNLLTVGPGQRQLTFTPVPRASSHSASENDSTNAFDA